MAIVEAVIAMAQKLSMEVLAEGPKPLIRLGSCVNAAVDNAQGYYFHRPMPAEQVEVRFTAENGMCLNRIPVFGGNPWGKRFGDSHHWQ